MATSPPHEPKTITANPEGWATSQDFELNFWKHRWPYRHLPLPELQTLRHGDAKWLMKNLGFAAQGERAFDGFKGTVLEVGCGPIGFFELAEDVRVTAIDSLMGAYAREIPYSLLGPRGSATYIDRGLEHIDQTFDFVVCSNVLDHTADWMEFLEELVLRVAPGGELLMMTDTRGKPILGHTQVFAPAQLRRALRWLGLTVEKHYRVEESKNDHCDYRVFARAARPHG